MKTVEQLVAEVITCLEGQNWTNTPLTDAQRALVRMAVQATLDQATLDLSSVPQEET